MEKTATAPTSAIVEYNPIAAALAGVEKYRGLVCDVTTPKGLAEAKAAHKEVAALRIALEKTRKKVKEDVLARSKLIDGEANRIFAQIAAIEDPIKTQIDAEDRRIEAERQAAIEAEHARIAKEEAERKAAEEKRLAEERAKNEAEARRLIEEKARFEAEQVAARQKVEAEERASRARIEDQERQARALRDEADRQAKTLRDAEETRLQQERDQLAAEQRAKETAERKVREEAEAKARAEQELKDAADRARRLLVTQKADARLMLELFKERHGHLPEFAGVVRAIDECLEPA